jgi:hypothetical protein
VARWFIGGFISSTANSGNFNLDALRFGIRVLGHSHRRFRCCETRKAR